MLAVALSVFVGVILVTDQPYGATVDDGTNDRTAIATALAAGVTAEDTVHFPAGVYHVNGQSSDIQIDVAATNRLVVTADAGAILYSECGGDGQYETLWRITGAAHGVSITDLQIEGNDCAAHLLAIEYEGDADNTVVLDGITATGGVQTSGNNFGIGLRVKGGFTAIDVIDPAIDGMATTGPCGGHASRGIEILPFCGASDYRTDDVEISGAVISNVVHPDGGCDADGIFVQTACETVPTGTWSVTDSTFIDCEYRSIKSQALGGTVSGSTFTRSMATGHHEIDCQYSDCTITGNTFRSIGFKASSVAAMAIRDIAAASAFAFSGNDVGYSGIEGTLPVQVYDLTTAGGDLDNVLIDDNEFRGTIIAPVFVSAPFAGTHDVTIQDNRIERLTDAGGLVYLPEDIDVGGAIIRNRIGSAQRRPTTAPGSSGHFSWDEAFGNRGWRLTP